MDKKQQIELTIKEFSKYCYINFFLSVLLLMIIMFWVINHGDIINIPADISFLKIFIKQMNQNAAIGLFFGCLISIFVSHVQIKKLYQIVCLLKEEIAKNSQD